MSVSLMSVLHASTATSDDVCPDYNSAMSRYASSSPVPPSFHPHQHRQCPLGFLRKPPSLAATDSSPCKRSTRVRPLQHLLSPLTGKKAPLIVCPASSKETSATSTHTTSPPQQYPSFFRVYPLSGHPTSGKFKFKLSIRTHGVERPLCEPIELTLSIDPRQLTFVVFVFPGKTKLTMGGLWCLRVWLRVNSIDHRLFGEDELWLGKDLDFTSIPDAAFARHMLTNPKEQIYTSPLGSASMNFIVRWQIMSQGTYKYTLDYEAGGVSSTLFDDLELRLDHDPRHITFVIYTIPQNSLPAGAAHGLRVWLRSPSPSRDPAIPSSYIYQRVWKTDTLKIGSRLNFDSLGSKVIMAHSRGGPETVIAAESPTLYPSSFGRSPTASLDGTEAPFFRHQLYR